jgi:uncharacterized surface anchored protein
MRHLLFSKRLQVLRREGLAVVLALAWMSGLAQTRPPVATVGPYSIEGTVVDAVSGEPLRRASVAALAQADSHTVKTAETGSDGRFALERLPAGKYQLTASKRGFRTAFYLEHEEFSTAIVTGPDQETTGLTFRLMPGAVLHGVITGDGGDPVERARVMLFQPPRSHASPGAGERIAQVDSATTDDTGAYEFNGLAAGDYLLAVVAEPWFALNRSSTRKRAKVGPASDQAAALDVAYPVTFFDSTTDEAAASRIQLANGHRVEADINLHAVPALRLDVALPQKREGASPSATLRQTIFGIEASTQMMIQDSGAATAEFTGVAPGHYEIVQGDPPRLGELDATASQLIDATFGVPGFSVSGLIRNASGSAAPEDAAATLVPLEGARRQAPLQATAMGGAFRFPTVPQGNWELWIESGGVQLPILSLASAGRLLAGNRVTVKGGALSLVVTLNRGGTRIEGFARKEGKGAAGAMVVLVPKDPNNLRWMVRRDQSDSDGSFSLRDVAPGQYKVVAIEDGWDLDWARTGGLSRYLQQGIDVTVTGSSAKLIQLSAPVPAQAH